MLVISVVGTTVQGQKAHKASHPTTRAAHGATVGWKIAYSDKDLTVSVDPKATKKEHDGTYKAHLRWQYAVNQAIGRGESYRVMDETRLVDCGQHRTKPIQAKTYDAKGKQVSSYTTKANDVQYLPWSTRKAGSTGANTIAGVCKVLQGA